MKSIPPPYKVFLIKKSNLDLIKSLDLNTSLQEIWGQRNMLKQHHKGTYISKWKCGKFYRRNHLLSSTDKLQDENKIGGETNSLKEL